MDRPVDGAHNIQSTVGLDGEAENASALVRPIADAVHGVARAAARSAPASNDGGAIVYRLPENLLRDLGSYLDKRSLKTMHSLNRFGRALFLESNHSLVLNLADLRSMLDRHPNVKHIRITNLPESFDARVLRAVSPDKRLTVQHLDLGACANLSDSTLVELATCFPNLLSLKLYCCTKLTDQVLPDLLQRLPNLDSLDLMNSNISDNAFTMLQRQYPNLTHLNLGLCRELTDIGLSRAAEYFPNLTSFELDFCRELTNQRVMSLPTSLPRLSYLSIAGRSLADLPQTVLENQWSNVVTLDLGECQEFHAGAIRVLAQCFPGLKSLSLSACRDLPDSVVRDVLNKFPHLELLDLSGYIEITDHVFTHLEGQYRALTSLRLNSCDITDDDIHAVARLFPSLTSLSVSDCGVIDVGVEAIGKFLPNLTFLDLSENVALSGDTVLSLVPNLPGMPGLFKLTSLDIGNCFVDDDVVIQLAKCLPNLKSLNLSFAVITDVALNALAERCKNLTSLNLDCCDNFTDEAIRALPARCTNLTSLSLAECEQLAPHTPAYLETRYPGLSVNLLRMD